MFMHPVKFYLHKSFVGKGTDLGWAPEVREVRSLDDPSHTHTHTHTHTQTCMSYIPFCLVVIARCHGCSHFAFCHSQLVSREITWMRVWNSMVSQREIEALYCDSLLICIYDVMKSHEHYNKDEIESYLVYAVKPIVYSCLSSPSVLPEIQSQ